MQTAAAVCRAPIARLCCFAIAIAATLSSGCCSTGYLTLRTLVCEPSKYCFKIDRIRSKSVYHRWAEDEWERAVQSCPDIPVGSAAYHAGFIDGFVDYVYAGGTGEPPPIPPRQFWNIEGRSPEGKAMANDWFAGFRHGARMGAEGGYRVLATLHTSFGDRSDLPPGVPVPGPLDYRSAESAAEMLPAPAATPTSQPSIPPLMPAESNAAPAVPNVLPLEAVPPNAEAVPPGVDAIPDAGTEPADGASSPPAPKDVNPFRTANAGPVIQAAAPVVETPLAEPLQPSNEQNDELTPAPLDLPSDSQPALKFASHETLGPLPVATGRTAATLSAAFAPVPPAATENCLKPAAKPLSKSELLELTAVPVAQPEEIEAHAKIDAQIAVPPLSGVSDGRLTKADLQELTALPLEQPVEIAASADVQTPAEIAKRNKTPLAPPKRDERTIREKNRSAYFSN